VTLFFSIFLCRLVWPRCSGGLLVFTPNRLPPTPVLAHLRDGFFRLTDWFPFSHYTVSSFPLSLFFVSKLGPGECAVLSFRFFLVSKPLVPLLLFFYLIMGVCDSPGQPPRWFLQSCASWTGFWNLMFLLASSLGPPSCSGHCLRPIKITLTNRLPSDHRPDTTSRLGRPWTL